MKKALLFIFIITFAVFGVFASGDKEAADGKVRIAVVSKGFQHEFWQTVKLGTEKAAEELGIETYFVGPPSESMVDQQINMVEDAITQRVTGLLLAALDSVALVPSVEKAAERGIVVGGFDSSVDSDIPVTFVATDNLSAGAIAAEELAKAINGDGLVAVVAHDATSGTGIQRRDGFINHIKANYPDITLIDTIYGGGDHQITMNKSLDLIKANPTLKAVYATNEGSAVGVGLAIKDADKADTITVIGFDSSEQEIGLLQEGVIDGFVVQNPYNMGYLGVKRLYEAITGETVEKVIDTGAKFVSLSNFNDADVQKLIYPLGK